MNLRQSIELLEKLISTKGTATGQQLSGIVVEALKDTEARLAKIEKSARAGDH